MTSVAVDVTITIKGAKGDLDGSFFVMHILCYMTCSSNCLTFISGTILKRNSRFGFDLLSDLVF
jgi:hypothetical protein